MPYYKINSRFGEKMKKIILLTIAASSIYARSYDYYSCDDLYSRYKSEYNNASGQYAYRKQDAYTHYCNEILGKAPDKSSYSVNEPEDQIKFLEIQKRTLGIACTQIAKGIQVSYKHEYCDILRSFDIAQVSQNTSMPAVNEIKPIQRKQIDPAIQYKNTPQLELNELHIYGINVVSNFKNKMDTILIESSTGRYAIPIKDVRDAKRINFTPELSQKLDALLH
jgi:hypothetical protein